MENVLLVREGHLAIVTVNRPQKLNALDAQGFNETFYHCVPHYFVLPMYSSASSYRFRPLGPEETLMEIWSLTRFPAGAEPPPPSAPEEWECDDPRWPPIPTLPHSAAATSH